VITMGVSIAVGIGGVPLTVATEPPGPVAVVPLDHREGDRP
jgi:hypothetical protein